MSNLTGMWVSIALMCIFYVLEWVTIALENQSAWLVFTCLWAVAFISTIVFIVRVVRE